MNKRYAKRIADYIIGQISFTGSSMRFLDYCHQIWNIAQSSHLSKMKLAFNIFDKDSDGRITWEDILNCMKDLKKTDWLIMEDLQHVAKILNNKVMGIDITKRKQSNGINLSTKTPSQNHSSHHKDSSKVVSSISSPKATSLHKSSEDNDSPFK